MLNKIIIIYIHIIILFIFKVIFMYKILNLTKFNKEKLKILLLNIYKKYVKISLWYFFIFDYIHFLKILQEYIGWRF